MPADFPFEESHTQHARIVNGDDAPFVYHNEDDGRLWDLLTIYADGEATEAEKAEVETLLRSDSAYAEDFALLKQMAFQMRSFAEVDPPAHLRDAILSVTTHRPTFSRRLLTGMEALRAAFSIPTARYGGAFATAALLTFVFWPRDNQVPSELPAAPPVVADVQTPPPSGTQNSEEGRKQDRGSTSSTLFAKRASGLQSPGATANPKIEARSKQVAKMSTGQVNLTPAINLDAKRQTPKNVVANAKPKRVNNKASLPEATEQNSSAHIAAEYGPRPMMDKDYQRPVEVAMKTEADDVSVKIRDYQPDDSSEPKGSGDSNSRVAANNSQDTSEAGLRTVQFRSGKTLPISRRYVSGADLKREHEAATLGYTRSTVLSIQRNELTGNVVGRF